VVAYPAGVLPELLLAGVAVLLGALVQGLVGFGMALVAVPIVALVEPTLLPVPMVVVGFTHAALSLTRERSRVDWRGVRWAMVGRLPGTAIGVLLVDRLAGRQFGLLVGCAVLGAVGLSLSHWTPAPTPRALLAAGLVSGAFGTAMSVGGPPLALIYQRAPGPAVRATLGAFLVLGSAISMAALLMAGQVDGRKLVAGLALVPFLLAGFGLSTPLRGVLDAQGLRVPVLLLCLVSAVTLIVRSL
jgi:uncharacterized membrane protein YfcA